MYLQIFGSKHLRMINNLIFFRIKCMIEQSLSRLASVSVFNK